ncbi:sialidase family protein [Sphingobacterium rhinopitheci]|uniref:sialidase family protein n=1 Tax=Sphingobacterium rhinopitheci TaxID=2781960 RepID=UPI001F518759|nr:sialidase family protein [Sphingobacterium rhinopitheci]MCI0922042.1 exo-alpha-sialidase [Sphingobacterium rhinopitheci]
MRTLNVTLVLLCLLYIVNACTATRKKENIVTSSFVLPEDRPFKQAHASTLVCLDSGNYLVAWFGGTKEKDDDVGIWMTKGDGATWSFPVEVAKIREQPHWNPVLFKKENGEIILFFKVGAEIAIWETWYISSTDNGQTWSKPQELVAGDRGGRGPVRNKPIVLSNGDWLAGSSDESGLWRSFVDVSTDKGNSWNKSEFIAFDTTEVKGEGMIQPTLWESNNGNVHMLLRTSAGAIYRSDSKDYGKTWGKAYKTGLPNPNSGIDLVKLHDGKLALLYNTDSKNWGSRAVLKLAISEDDGNTWKDILDVENGVKGDEFSYPAIVSCGDEIALTYTWKRSNIMFKRVKLNE